MRSLLRSAIRSLAGRRLGSRSPLFALALALPALLAAGPGAAQQAMPLPQVWTGRVILPEGVQPGVTGDQIQLRVSQLSTDKEISELLAQLQIGGQTALRDAMRRLGAKGFLSIGKLAAAEVTVIRVVDPEGGRRRLRLFCDFPIRLYDKSEERTSAAHPFGFLELEVDSSGEGGVGTLIAAASLGLNDEGLRVETAATPILSVIDVTTDRPPAPPARR